MLVLISCIDKSHLLLALGELTSGGLFFYDAGFESVGISHFLLKFLKIVLPTSLFRASQDILLILMAMPFEVFLRKTKNGAGERVRTVTPKG